MISVDKFYWNEELDCKLRAIYGTMLIADVAQALNTKISSVRHRASKLGLKRSKRRYTINQYFFSECNIINSYWAGFIAADGCLHTQDTAVSIGLNKRDKDHLRSFAECAGSNHPIHTYADMCVFKIHGLHHWFVDLLKFNIVPQKTLVLIPPQIENEEYIRAFIRGYIDGDGCISQRSDRKSWTVSCVGTWLVTDWVSRQIANFIGVNNNVPSSIGSIYNVGWEGPQTKYIVEWLYKDSTPLTRLDRKYQLAQKLLADYQNKEPKKHTSEYRGISYYQREQKWVAAIKLLGKKQVIGYFDTEREAALSYNQKARELGLVERCYAVS